MARYSVDGQDTSTAATTLLGITGSAAVRAKIYDLTVGSISTPADNGVEYAIQRTTVAGTGGSALTPITLDPLTSAAVSACQEAPTAEPTYTANSILLQWAQNQRATYRWVAAPGGELVSVAAAAAGLGVQVISIAGSAVIYRMTIHFEE